MPLLVPATLYSMGMDTDLCETLMRQHENISTYKFPLMINHGDICADVMSAGHYKTIKPCDAPDQPKSYPEDTCYHFDRKFIGPSAFDSLAKEIDDATFDSSLYIQKRGIKCYNGELNEMRCSCYKVLKDDPSQFNGSFQKKGTNLATVKKQRTQNEKYTIDRMASSTMKKGGTHNVGKEKKGRW